MVIGWLASNHCAFHILISTCKTNDQFIFSSFLRGRIRLFSTEWGHPVPAGRRKHTKVVQGWVQCRAWREILGELIGSWPVIINKMIWAIVLKSKIIPSLVLRTLSHNCINGMSADDFPEDAIIPALCCFAVMAFWVRERAAAACVCFPWAAAGCFALAVGEPP